MRINSDEKSRDNLLFYTVCVCVWGRGEIISWREWIYIKLSFCSLTSCLFEKKNAWEINKNKFSRYKLPHPQILVPHKNEQKKSFSFIDKWPKIIDKAHTPKDKNEVIKFQMSFSSTNDVKEKNDRSSIIPSRIWIINKTFTKSDLLSQKRVSRERRQQIDWEKVWEFSWKAGKFL